MRDEDLAPSEAGLLDGLTTGIVAIDAEHAVQLAQVDAVIAALSQGRPADEVAAAVERLAGYTEAHFLGEQLLMRQEAYPAYEQHLQEHDRLIGRLRELKLLCAKGPLSGDEPALFRDWLLAHIQTEDIALAGYLRARREGSS
ncbi:MAG: bacteriohemerythrin [Vicinamibacteria bacterium]